MVCFAGLELVSENGVENGVGVEGYSPSRQTAGSLCVTGDRVGSFANLAAADSDSLRRRWTTGGVCAMVRSAWICMVVNAPQISRSALFWAVSMTFRSPFWRLSSRNQMTEA